MNQSNSEIIRSINNQTKPEGHQEKRKSVNIIALHLGMGGVEKAIISMANLFAQRYDVTLYSIYNMPGSPAFAIDDRVNVVYMLRDVPNREEWKAALRERRPIRLVKESFRSVKILLGKKHAVKKIIKSINSGVLITTRHEDNIPLSKYGKPGVLKIAQLHHDHNYLKKYVKGFKYQYGGIDVLAMLTPQLVTEVQQLMEGHNSHTEVIYMPNFLEHFPEAPEQTQREKIVLAAGRLAAVKRFDLLIKNFANIHNSIPEWKLRILGDGEDLDKLQCQIRDLGADDYIILAGRKNGKEVEQEMLKAAFFAMSSSSEGFPFVLLEAQSCALPILAYDVRVGPGFIVHDGEDGYLVPEGDETAYEQRMVEMMENPEMLQRMGKTAAIEAMEFSRENVANKWYSVIEK